MSIPFTNFNKIVIFSFLGFLLNADYFSTICYIIFNKVGDKMIHEIYPYIYNNEYKNVTPKENDIILIYENSKIMLKEKNNNIVYPNFKDIQKIYKNLKYRYLFSIDDINYFLIEDKYIDKLNCFELHSTFILRKTEPLYQSFAGITGYQLYDWYSRNKYCGKCGAKMYHSENSRAMVCPKCDDIRYPFLAPAVIVGIIDNDRLLVTRYARSKYRNYALVAGYAEIGENIEDTVRREVMEEVGLKVKKIKYYKSQPWSFSGSLLFGFFCEVDGTDNITLDEDELAMAKWVTRDELNNSPNLISLTAEMIQLFKEDKIHIEEEDHNGI